jgi:hypothetical protein
VLFFWSRQRLDDRWVLDGVFGGSVLDWGGGMMFGGFWTRLMVFLFGVGGDWCSVGFAGVDDVSW